MLSFTESPVSPLAIFLFSFAESSFFPIPPDLLLIALCTLNPEKAILFSALTTIGSVFGGVAGYAIGLKGGLPLLQRIVSRDKIDKIHSMFNRYNAWAITIAGLTPLPYKVFTLSAGTFYIDFKTFVLASTLSRGTRFFAEGLLIMVFEKRIQDFLKQYFDLFSILFILTLIGGFVCLRALSRLRIKRDG
jgi:membrane protein YqaA with SNARE-associated domain